MTVRKQSNKTTIADVMTAFRTIADWCDHSKCKKCPALMACENNIVPGDTMANVAEDFIQTIGDAGGSKP